jgi:protocatechuate 3,4-dioxygenase beta subunit
LRYGQGVAATLSGTVRDTAGRAVDGAAVEIWQCDQQGHYRHPGDGGRADPAFQGFGRVSVGRDGSYRFRTIRPVPYSGRTPHIHVKVRLGARELLTTQLYVEGEPANPRDGLWRRLDAADRAALTVPFVADGANAVSARFDIVVVS